MDHFEAQPSVGPAPSTLAEFPALAWGGLRWICLFGLMTLPVSVAAVSAQYGPVDCSQSLPPSDEDRQFYYSGSFGPRLGGVDMARVHSCHLRLMKEHPLAQHLNHGEGQVFRLMVWPAYQLPLIVRLKVKPDGTGELVAKAEKSLLEPGTLLVNRTAEVSKSEVAKFIFLLQQAEFWSMHTDEFYAENQRLAAEASANGVRRAMRHTMGGVSWNLEGVMGVTYHLVLRTSPGPGPDKSWENKPYAQLVFYLFRDLAKLEVPPMETTPKKH